MKSISARERAWRARNPTLAVKFDRLNASVKHNIRTADFGKDTAKLVRMADEYRREARRTVDRKRRTLRQQVADYVNLTPAERSALARTVAVDSGNESAFWRTYSKQMGR
jgi:hypothetical protein